MYSVTFSDGVDSWGLYKDWGLIQLHAPVITAPEIEKNYINVPAMDGFLDLSESLVGRPVFKSREFKAEYVCISKREEWSNIISNIMTALHGKELEIYIDDDFTNYYSGRVIVGEPTMEKRTFTLSINATLKPWRYEKENREITFFCPPDGYVQGEIIGTRMPAVPNIHVEVAPGKPFHITEVNGKTVDYIIEQGDNFIPQLELHDGENTITIESTGYGGHITFSYQGGRL